MSGIGVNTGELVAAGSSVRGAADPVRDEHSRRVGDIGVGQAEFGRVHGQHFAGYRTGMDKLSKCVANMADAMDDFAEKLEQTGSGYEWTESGNAETIAGSGGQ